ncbi:MAG: hypothetical protein GY944_12430 [bacterium]|nr:hypothetical protein [bacterium]
MSEPKPKGSIPEPTVRASLANGFQVFLDDAAPLLVVGALVIGIGIVARTAFLMVTGGKTISVLALLLLAGPLEFGMSFVCLRAVRSGRVNFEHLIAVLTHYWPLVIANALLSAILPGALALLLIPGIVFFCMTRFVAFLILEDELGGAEAIVESIRLSREHFWTLLGINAVGFTVTTLLSVSLLGVIPAMIWWNLSLASLYHSVARPPKGWQIEDEEELEAGRLEAELEEQNEQDEH